MKRFRDQAELALAQVIKELILLNNFWVKTFFKTFYFWDAFEPLTKPVILHNLHVWADLVVVPEHVVPPNDGEGQDRGEQEHQQGRGNEAEHRAGESRQSGAAPSASKYSLVR